MASTETKDMQFARSATLKLSHKGDTPVLSARFPSGISGDEFGRVAKTAFDVISKMTAHPCMSGRVKFVVEDRFLDEVTRVDLRSGQTMPG